MKMEELTHKKENIIIWLQNWYKQQCNDEWEHSYGISIDNIDNPGWKIEIDLKDTLVQNRTLEYKLVDNSENDWYSYKVTDNKYVANGDPDKLEFLLHIFREFVEGNLNRKK
jgi:hypothetical protein